MKTIIGIDEAGRGPVIGPMVMAGVSADEKDIEKFKSLGVKDSKLLSPQQRKFLFNEIKKIAKDYKIIIISPKEIDSSLNSKDLNLNWLEAIRAADIINQINSEKAIVDCPSNNINAYTAYLLQRIKNKKIELVVEHKADMKYAVVSAASILAKVTRDNEIKKIQDKITQPIGSGYPSDPITKEFIKNNYMNYPGIFRKTWASYKRLAGSKKQKHLLDF
ncbi:MAG: ribonuclease HII [Candidatus Nanoarchaeia archaeon]|nr:ribonuclease HII [Candidatus Nanoarchaeia archaeon]